MDVKKTIISSIIVIVLIISAAFIADHRRKSIDAGEIDKQLSLLDREHRERQRELENNLGELGSLTENAIASLEGAGAIVERTGNELQSAATDLRSAKNILKNIAIQIQVLQSELDSCRADLYRIRGLDWMGSGGEVKHPSLGGSL